MATTKASPKALRAVGDGKNKISESDYPRPPRVLCSPDISITRPSKPKNRETSTPGWESQFASRLYTTKTDDSRPRRTVPLQVISRPLEDGGRVRSPPTKTPKHDHSAPALHDNILAEIKAVEDLLRDLRVRVSFSSHKCKPIDTREHYGGNKAESVFLLKALHSFRHHLKEFGLQEPTITFSPSHTSISNAGKPLSRAACHFSDLLEQVEHSLNEKATFYTTLKKGIMPRSPPFSS